MPWRAVSGRMVPWRAASEFTLPVHFALGAVCALPMLRPERPERPERLVRQDAVCVSRRKIFFLMWSLAWLLEFVGLGTWLP